LPVPARELSLARGAEGAAQFDQLTVSKKDSLSSQQTSPNDVSIEWWYYTTELLFLSIKTAKAVEIFRTTI